LDVKSVGTPTCLPDASVVCWSNATATRLPKGRTPSPPASWSPKQPLLGFCSQLPFARSWRVATPAAVLRTARGPFPTTRRPRAGPANPGPVVVPEPRYHRSRRSRPSPARDHRRPGQAVPGSHAAPESRPIAARAAALRRFPSRSSSWSSGPGSPGSRWCCAAGVRTNGRATS